MLGFPKLKSIQNFLGNVSTFFEKASDAQFKLIFLSLVHLIIIVLEGTLFCVVIFSTFPLHSLSLSAISSISAIAYKWYI